MALSPGYVEHVRELFAGMGDIRIRKMFGGAAIYLDDVIFALVDDDVTYLRAKGAFADELKSLGCKVWRYPDPAGGAPRAGAYWSLPLDAEDDPEVAVQWGRRAHTFAAQSAQPRKPAKRRAGAAAAKARKPGKQSG